MGNKSIMYKSLFTSRRTTIYISADYDLHHEVLRFYIKSCTARTYSEVRRINRVKSKFSECPDFSCSRSDGTLEPVKNFFPAESESLGAYSQSSEVV